MKAKRTIANYQWISGLEACAAQAMKALQSNDDPKSHDDPTVRVKVGKWRASMVIKKRDRGCCIVVTEPPVESQAWFRDVEVPTTAEEMACALVSTVRSYVDNRRDLYTAVSEALAEEGGAT